MLTALLTLLLIGFCGCLVYAVLRHPEWLNQRFVSVEIAFNGVSGPMQEMTPISTESTAITVCVSNASVSISRQGEGSQIAVRAHYPENWSREGNSVLQTGEKYDVLEIVVPTNYRGGLSVRNEGANDVTLDTWTGGTVTLVATANGAYNGGDLLELESFQLQAGSDNCEFGDISAGQFAAELGSGSLTTGDIKAQSYKLSASGSGDVEMNNLTAETADFQFTRESYSNLSAAEMAVRKLTFRSDGTGDIEVEKMTGSSADVTITDNANWNVTEIDYPVYRHRTSGSGDFGSDSLTCVESGVIVLDEGSYCNVELGTVDGSFRLESKGRGNFSASTIKGGSAYVQLAAEGDFSAEEIEVAGRFESEQTASGDASADSLKCHEAVCRSTDYGDLTIGYLEATSAQLINEGTRNIEVEDGRADKLEMTLTGEGDITVSGDYPSTTTHRSGAGDVYIN